MFLIKSRGFFLSRLSSRVYGPGIDLGPVASFTKSAAFNPVPNPIFNVVVKTFSGVRYQIGMVNVVTNFQSNLEFHRRRIFMHAAARATIECRFLRLLRN